MSIAQLTQSNKSARGVNRSWFIVSADRLENLAAATALLAMAILPAGELALRLTIGIGIPASVVYVSNLTIWVGMLGAIITTRTKRHLDLSTGLAGFLTKFGVPVVPLVAFVSGAAVAGLFWSALQFVMSGLGSSILIGDWLPEWIVQSILPLAFGAIVLRLVANSGSTVERAASILGIIAAAAAGFAFPSLAEKFLAPGLFVLMLAALIGAPIYVILGGGALLLFFADGVPVAAIMVEAYRVVASPAIALIPLFTFTGHVLAHGHTTERLVRLFDAWFGWMPGGLAIAATMAAAFFSAFTGASGVAILALGGLLLPVLLKNGYPERFSIGLLTASGSLGLLFPPSLAVILYGVVAHVPIPDLFAAAAIPGLVMVVAVSLLGVRAGIRAAVPRPRFDLAKAAAALWAARWEVLLPVVAFAGLFGGFCTFAEAAALTAVYALVTQILVHRDLNIRRDLAGILVECATMIGGVFIIISAALGLSNYLIDAEIPTQAVQATQQMIHSRVLFLLALNLFLLIVGCLMDVYSATVVALPLILPIATAFGIPPLHIAVIFLANLELGYLTPPVGMNLFLASLRFNKPVLYIARCALPLLLLLLAVVLAITYVPLLYPGYGLGARL